MVLLFRLLFLIFRLGTRLPVGSEGVTASGRVGEAGVSGLNHGSANGAEAALLAFQQLPADRETERGKQ